MTFIVLPIFHAKDGVSPSWSGYIINMVDTMYMTGRKCASIYDIREVNRAIVQVWLLPCMSELVSFQT